MISGPSFSPNPLQQSKEVFRSAANQFIISRHAAITEHLRRPRAHLPLEAQQGEILCRTDARHVCK
jgi:hypothetical protein